MKENWESLLKKIDLKINYLYIKLIHIYKNILNIINYFILLTRFY